MKVVLIETKTYREKRLIKNDLETITCVYFLFALIPSFL